MLVAGPSMLESTTAVLLLRISSGVLPSAAAAAAAEAAAPAPAPDEEAELIAAELVDRAELLNKRVC